MADPPRAPASCNGTGGMLGGGRTCGAGRRGITPELARIPQIVPHTPQAESAVRELAKLRDHLQEELERGAEETAP